MRTLLFFLSFFGWMAFARQKTRMPTCFLPVFTASAQTLVLILCGMCGFLLPAAYAVTALGLAVLVYCAVKEKQRILLPWCNAGSLFALLGIGVLYVLLRGKVVGHFDNFTHWALIVRHLLTNNALPNAGDTLITYSNYPLGSSMWIYLFSTCTGMKSEDMWLFAQGIYMVFCLQTLLVCMEDKRGAVITVTGLLLTAVYANFALAYNVTIYNLLVDALLPLCALALCLAAGYTYLHIRDDRLALRTDASPWLLIPLMGMVLQIKTSGVVFLLVPLGLMIASALRSKSRRAILRTLLGAAIPFALLLMWNVRHSIVFGGAEAGKHAVSLSTMQEKSLQEIGTILLAALREMLTGRDMLFLLVPVFVAFAALFSAKQSAAQVYGWVVLVCAVMYVVYSIGIVGMYIFSMPLEEALNLAGITRYRRSMLIWIYGMLYASMFFSLTQPSGVFAAKKPAAAAAGAVLLACLVTGWYFTNSHYNRLVTLADGYRCEELEMRQELEAIITAEHIQGGGRYILCLPPDQSGSYHQVFYGFLLRYLTDSDDVTVTAQRSIPATPGTWCIHLPD